MPYGYNVECDCVRRAVHDVNLVAATTGHADWDSVAETPGVDDNASGVAGLLEIAGARARPTGPRAVRFYVFDGEEPGCAASYAHVARLHGTGCGVEAPSCSR